MPTHLRHIRRLAALGIAAAGLSLAGQPAADSQQIELIPSGPLSFDERTGEAIATEGAQIIYGEWLLTADTIRFNQKTNEAKATGNVVFTRADMRLIADSLLYRPAEEFARVENFRAGNGQVYVDGSLLEGNPDDFRFKDINFYPGEPGTFLFVARAGELSLTEGNVVRGKRLFFKVGAIPFLLIPNITQPLDAETNLFRPKLDYSGQLGAALGAEALAPVGNNLRLGANVALTSKRGILAGPAARYENDEGGSKYAGAFISGFINDSGDLGVDVNGDPIDDDRGFAEWQHQQFWDGNRASVSAYLRYWSDSEVTRDFYDESFDRMQDPDSYLDAKYNGDNWQLSLLGRAALSDFQSHTERLPELRFDLLPTRILAKDLTESAFISAAKLQSGQGSANRDATRLDAFYGVEFTRPLRPGVNLRLKAGARGYRYEDASVRATIDGREVEQRVDGQRAFGEFGADVSAKATRVFALQNETWDIDGIRHIFEPMLSYRYTPEIESSDALDGRFLIGGPSHSSIGYGYDYETFGNYLTPIDIEDRRDADSLAEENKFRIALRNRIQTRSKDGGARDLASLDIAADYYMAPSIYRQNLHWENGEPEGDDRFSLLQTELSLTPAPWLEATVLTRLDPEDGLSEKETSARIVVQDPGYWRVGFGAQFLKGANPKRVYQVGSELFPIPLFDRPYYGYTYTGADIVNRARLEQYYTFVEYSFSENLKAYASVRYDDQTGLFYDQSIGIMQRALERYGIKYEIRFYEGDRRERDFGISVGIDLFDE